MSTIDDNAEMSSLDLEKNGCYHQLLNVPDRGRLSPSCTAALTVSTAYLAILFLFAMVFCITIPRPVLQVYNVTISSEVYQATLTIEADTSFMPLFVEMKCVGYNGEELRVLYDMVEKVVAYKDQSLGICYIRPNNGELYKDDYTLFHSIILGMTPLTNTPKQAVHLSWDPEPLHLHLLRKLLGHRAFSFCSQFDSFWLAFSNENVGNKGIHRKIQRNEPDRTTLTMDACFNDVILHKIQPPT